MLETIIKSRRSVFPNQYTGSPISKEDLTLILESARWAPTHRRTEPWRFVVFHSEEAREQLSAYLGDQYKSISGDNYLSRKEAKARKKPVQSAAVIAIVMQRDLGESVPEWEEIAATAMAVQNMWLTATDLGLGGYWSSPKTITHNAEDFLALEEGQRCLGLFYLGHWETVDLLSQRKELHDIVKWR